MDVPTAARILGIGRNTAYRYFHAGTLPGAQRLGNRRIVVSRSVLATYLDARTSHAAARADGAEGADDIPKSQSLCPLCGGLL